MLFNVLAIYIPIHTQITYSPVKQKQKYLFRHNTKQRSEIDSYLDLFGSDILGITRTLTRARITEFYRKAYVFDSTIN